MLFTQIIVRASATSHKLDIHGCAFPQSCCLSFTHTQPHDLLSNPVAGWAPEEGWTRVVPGGRAQSWGAGQRTCLTLNTLVRT